MISNGHFSLLCCLLAAASFWTTPRAADGDLDLSFAPTASAGQTFQNLRPYDGHVYFTRHQSNGDKILRLRDDGRLDPNWTDPRSVISSVEDFSALPSGGFAIKSGGGLFLDRGDGVPRGVVGAKVSYAGLFVRDDGSVILAPTVQRFMPDGTVDPEFGADTSLEPAVFLLNGQSVQAGPDVRAVQDSHERIILVGHLLRAGGQERLGLVRLLPNGRPDPSWNPGPALGILLEGENQISALPVNVSLGPDDSVLVVLLEKVGSEGLLEKVGYRLATVDDTGRVTASFLMTNEISPIAPVVQPDGRILVCGDFDNREVVPASGLIRLNRDGTRDFTFNVVFGGPTNRYFTDLVLAPSGNLLIAGMFDSVNGVARPGLARLLAYRQPESSPLLSMTAKPAKIATNEILRLTADVGGYPPPDLQWYQDGEPIPGATNRGLRLVVLSGDSLMGIRLVSTSPLGTNQLDFPPVPLVQRSVRPGSLDPHFELPLGLFIDVNQLLPLPNGQILVASGPFFKQSEDSPVVGRLNPDGTLDSNFGESGVVKGNGRVIDLQPLAGGGILVAGRFTMLGGTAASGLAELDANGRRTATQFPELDNVDVTSALQQPDGSYVLAGDFRSVGGKPAFKIARLRPDHTLDPSFTSPLEPWHLVDSVALDAQNRLVIAGSSIDGNSPVPGTASLGVRRLRADGSFDPEFHPLPNGKSTILPEPDGRILVGMPLVRLGENGEVVTVFQKTGRGSDFDSSILSHHRMARLANGRVVAALNPGPSRPGELIRWTSDGLWDSNFSCVLGTNHDTPWIRAVAPLSDGSVLVCTANTFGPGTLHRVAPDPDRTLTHPRLVAGHFVADLATQPQVVYQIQSRASLDETPSSSIQTVSGDGYVQEISLPAVETQQFLQPRRD